MWIQKLSSLAILLSAIAAKDSIDLLANQRRDIRFMAYRPEERVHVAQEVEKIFSIYVNTDSKVHNYGKEFRDIDPRPRAARLVSQAANMSDNDFHFNVSALFNSLRDFHTLYTLPGPYSCFTAITSLRFDFIESAVVVSGIRRHGDFEKRTALDKILANIEIGDQLISYNGMSFKEYSDSIKWRYGGANDFGSQRSAASSMSVIPGKLYAMPEKNSAAYVLKSASSGDLYNVSLPWIALKDGACYEEVLKIWKRPLTSMPAYTEDTSMPLLDHPFKPPMKQKTIKDNLLMGSDTRRLCLSRQKRARVIAKTPESCLSWEIYSFTTSVGEPRTMGIIHFTSFEPESLERAFSIIRGLLLKELQYEDCIVFDVRDNGGGYMTLANILPQLFSPHVKLIKGRTIANQLNKKVFESYNDTKWVEAIEQSRIRYSHTVSFDDLDTMTSFGTAYLKPVGVFTNANCFSSCDMFSAVMRDSNAAITFGEDGTTGAGGANVIEHESFLSVVAKDEFSKLPYTDKLENGGAPTISMAWRQMVRNGHEGRIIEDVGVKSTYIVRPSLRDLQYPDKTPSSQYDRIAKILYREGQKSKRNGMKFLSSPFEADVRAGTIPAFKIESSKLDDVKIRLKSIYHKRDFVHQKLDPSGETVVNMSHALRDIDIHRYELLGSMGNELFARQWQVIRVIPELQDYIQVRSDKPGRSNNASIGQGVYIYNHAPRSPPAWTITGNSFVIEGPYAGNLNTQISWFFAMESSRARTIVIRGKHDTEKEADFLFCGYKNGSDEPILFNPWGWSGSGTINLSQKIQNVEKEFEVFCRFASDESVSGNGIEITSVVIR